MRAVSTSNQRKNNNNNRHEHEMEVALGLGLNYPVEYDGRETRMGVKTLRV